MNRRFYLALVMTLPLAACDSSGRTQEREAAVKKARAVVYQGRPLAQWIGQIADRDPQSANQATAALQACPAEAAVLCLDEIRQQRPTSEKAAELLAIDDIAKHAQDALPVLEWAVKAKLVTPKTADQAKKSIRKWSKEDQ